MTDEITKEGIAKKFRAIMDEKDEIKAREKELNEQKQQLEGIAIPMMQAEGMDKFVVNGVGTISIKDKVVWQPKDWSEIYTFIIEHLEPSLLQKRLSEPKIKELLEDGIDIPGIEKLELPKLSFRRST